MQRDDDRHVTLADIVPDELPDWRELVARGRKAAASIVIPRTLFREVQGVRTQEEFRIRMAQEDRIVGQMNIGLRTWEETAEALRHIHARTSELGFDIHSFHVLIDRRMGLPPEMRSLAPQETGPMLEADRDWSYIGQVVPMEPHLVDFIVGSPASVTNTIQALRSGITHVGTVSQFVWSYPYYDNDVAQMAATVEALAILAAKRAEGVSVGTYMDDGYPAIYHDYASLVGYARLERYLVEEILGAELTTDWGGLSYDPATKPAVTMALERLNVDRHFTSFRHCNTTEYVKEFTQNYGVLSTDMLFTVMTEKRLHAKGWPGAAIIPIPVTEAVRIPSADEIVDAHIVLRRAEKDARLLMDVVDWEYLEDKADMIVEGSERFFKNAMTALTDMGVDVSNPLSVLLALRRLGGPKTEELFATGEPDSSYPRGRRPVVATDMLKDVMQRRSQLLEECLALPDRQRLTAMTAVVASTDIHEFGVFLVKETLAGLGTRVVDGGQSADPEYLAKVALETNADLVAVSTHNGMALSYGESLLKELRRLGARATVAMGGILNEPVDDSPTPVDVRNDLERIGVMAIDDIGAMVRALL